MNRNRKFVSRVVSSIFAMFVLALMLTVGALPATGQACASQNWAASTPNIWAAGGSIKVMLNNDATTNQPTIPTYLYDGNFNPWGYEQHPQAITDLNSVWSCPSGTPSIKVAGAGRETISFQIFISAGVGSNSALSDVSVAITPLTGAGTLTSDNTGTSNVTRYLEGYVPFNGVNPASAAELQANGQMPDPLIPFYDPYDSGNPAVATPFNVLSGTTQGVWVNISIPANQPAGAYTGTVTVSGNGIGTVSIPVQMTVWNGNLPTFDAGSVNPTYADMLKSWLPFYEGNFINGEGLTCGGPGCTTGLALFQKYQIMGHAYDVDVQDEGYADSPVSPTNGGCYPSYGSCTSFTTDGTTSSLNWTNYDLYMGPSLTPGGLFSDGTYMRVIDSPLSSGSGAGPWVAGGWNWYDYENGGTTPPPSGLLQLMQNYATQISQHFAAKHANAGWGTPELLSYTYDETYNQGANQLGHVPILYQDISLFNEAINSSNSALSSTWAASAFPIRPILSDMPACFESPDVQDNNGNYYYTDAACADHINLSYPGGANATAGFTNSWVTAWSSNPLIFMPGRPGPPLNYGVGTPLTQNTGYQYTFDLTDGVPALSTAPVPIERWFYQGGDPFSSQEFIGSSGVGERINYWIAYKYGLDETVASVGDPNPAAPSPGGVWIWVGDYWGPGGDVGSSSSASNCNSPAPSPFVSAPGGGNGVLFYPGNEIGCYYSANAVGSTILTANPAVNTSCTSNGYSVCNGISGPVASMGLEQMRRGYEDYEYLYLLGKQSGRSASMAIINSLGGGGITAGGLGTTGWQALDWENTNAADYAMGVEPQTSAYNGNCTDSTPGIGGVANGLPNGPTGAATTGSSTNYNPCPGEWTNNPYRFATARQQLAVALGFVAATGPSVTGLSPSSGANAGGTSVIITGTNFTGATEVQFGGVEATSFTVNSSTQITAVSPGGSGTVAVQVFGPAGASAASSSDLYSYVSPVTVTGLSPSSGVAAGGTSVNITGTDFSAGAVVLFGTKAATNVVVNSATSITATAPAGTGTVNVTVTASLGTSATNSADVYTYEAPPTVTSVSPSSGPIVGGTSVTLGGTGFASGMTVDFGGNAATSVAVNSSTSATVTSPAGSSDSGGLVNVTVTTTDGTSAIYCTAGSCDQFSYTSPVTVTGLSVKAGPPAGGTSVVITGTGFTGATAVKFGGNTASFTVNSSTQITATSPAGGGTVDVTVTTPPYSNTRSYADQFTYSSAVDSGVFATLPTTTVGSTSASTNVTVTLQSASVISSITIPPTQNGVEEFVVGSVTGCTIGGASNAAGTVCTVHVTFKPQYPGVRLGALDINNNGAVIGTAGLAGIGQGSEVVQSPGSLTMAIGGGVNGVTTTPQSVTTAAFSVSGNGSALAMDGAGNLYIADDNASNNCLAYKVNAITNQIVAIAGDYLFTGTGTAPSTTPEPALGSSTCPQAIAVDGAGNVYVVDAKNNLVTTQGAQYPGVVEEISATTGQIFVMAGGGSNAPSKTAQTATSVALSGVNSLATDASGNLYISDFFNNLVEKVTPAGQLSIFAGGGSTPVSTTPQAATSAALNGPTGMVMDDAGNFYISDQNIGVIEKVNSSGQIVSVAGGGTTEPSTTPQPALNAEISNPAGLAVDGAGDLYIADYSNDKVERVNPAGQLVVIAGGGSTIPSATAQTATSAQLGNIEGVEVDGAGNVYIADGQNIGNGNNMVEKVATVIAPLSFPFTSVGSTSVPQPVNLTNIGNEALTLNNVSATTDFPLQSSGTCTVTASNSQTLAVGTTCDLMYAFHPTVGGVLNESATLTDNSLNASGAQQGIALTGTATGGTNPQLTSIGPSTGSSGTSVTVTGTNLSGATEMTFGSTPVTPNSDTSTSVTATAPSGSGTVNVTVTTANGTSNAESFTYTSTPAATPTFSPAAGTYTSTQTVTISDGTSGATIYYTTNGTTPTTSSSVYSGPITVSATETVKAIATASGYTTSATGSAAYTINLTAATPTFSPAAGTYTSAQTVTISDGTSGATIYYTTNGTTPTTSSTVYLAPITVSATETVKALAVKSGYTNSAVGSAAYTINLTAAATPTFSPAAGTYTSAQTVTISDATSGATIYYTTNGSTPTTGSTVYSSPISVSASETVKAIAAKAGYTTSAVGSAAYTINPTAATPTFSPAAGTYTSAQMVTISDGTSGATIHYTTNGSTPTTGSTVYSSPISVSASETVKAIAAKSGYTNSAVGSATYTINTGGGSYPVTDAFSGTGALSSNWTNTSASGYVALAQASGKILPSVSGDQGIATYTGVAFTSDQYSQGVFVAHVGSGNNTGLCVRMNTSGSGVCWFPDDRAVGRIINGAWSNGVGPSGTCPLPASGDTVKLSVVGNTYTCADVTTGATDSGSDVNPSAGNPGVWVDQRSSTAYAMASFQADCVPTCGGSSTPAATPMFSPAAGTYTSAQTVTISDATSGATIYYTTNGSTPTTSSTVYSSPIHVSNSETVEAIATASGYTTSAVGSAAYTINLSPDITTIAGVQGGTTNPVSGTVAYGNSIGGSRYGIATAPVLNGAGGDVYFDGDQSGLYVIYKGGVAAKAILAADGISSPVTGDVYALNLGLNETGPYMPTGLFVDSYGNLLIADRGYARVYMLYAGTVTGQGTNPADALIVADPSTWEVGYGLHVGYLYHIADGGSVVGSAPTNITPKGVWVDSKENVFFTDGSGNGLVEVVYNTTGTSANAILTTEGYTSLKQGYTYIIAGGQSTATYPNDNDGGSSVAYNGSTSTANTALNNPWGIYGDSAGDLIFADDSSNKIKKLSGSTAVLTTIGGPAAGTATTVGHGGDGGPATSAQMHAPIGVILDASGNVYFADSGNSSVRMIGTNGNISTVAGTSGTSGTYTGEGGPATSAVMNTTYFLSIDGSGNIYIVDDGNDLIHVF